MRSSIWMLVNSVLSRGITFFAQVALSIMLAKSDFGVYAAAMSISALLTNLRGAGMGQWLTQGGQTQFESRAGHAFWTSLLFNAGLGLLMIGIATPAAAFFGDDRIGVILRISGASFPIISIGSYYTTVLAINLRMREVTTIELTSTLLRYALIIVLASVGFGPLSFVIPLPISYALEGFAGYFYTRDKAWHRRPEPRKWLPLVFRNRWIMIGTFVTTISLQADYFTLGKLTKLSTLGVYYFAYQMTYMSAALITENARRVLFPGLVAVPAERRPAASLRAATICTVLGAPLLMLLGAVMSPLETVVWHGKWQDAVVPIQLFSLGMPLQLMTTVTQSSLQSDGRFRLWSSVNALRAVCVVLGASIAGLLFTDNIQVITGIITLALAVANAGQVWIVYAAQGIGLGKIARACLASLTIAPAGLCVTVLLDHRLDLDPVLQIVIDLGFFTATWLILTLLLDRVALRTGIAALRSAASR